MGFHFMNPVPVMSLVELIRGIATDKETFDTCLGVVETLGKTAASAEDFPAFIVNRILDADDQRGGLHPLRGGGQRAVHRPR